MTEQSVVITGIGLITEEARSPDELFARLMTKVPGATRRRNAEATVFTDPAETGIEAGLGMPSGFAVVRRDRQWDSPPARLAVYAADQAFAQSGLDERRRRAGVFTASTRLPFAGADQATLSGSFDCADSSVDLNRLGELACHQSTGYFEARRDHSALVLAHRYNFPEAMTISGGSWVAGGIAIGTAYRYIRHGELEVAMAGGSKIVCRFLPFVFFNLLGMSCHFQRHNPSPACVLLSGVGCGFALGAGSAFLLLESAEHAHARGAKILARIIGFAGRAKGDNAAFIHESGDEFAGCMQAALDDAGLVAEDIDYINAYGASVNAVQAEERVAIARVFGDHAAAIPISINPLALEQMAGVNGAVETVLSILTLVHGMVPPTSDYPISAPESWSLDTVAEPRRRAPISVMSNSFGSAGEHCSLILAAA